MGTDESDARKAWRERAERCLSSGKPVKKWCAANGVNSSMMYRWIKAFREEDPGFFPKGAEPSGAWVEIPAEEVRAAEVPAPGASREARILIGPAEVRVPLGVDGADVLGILEAVTAL